MQNKNNALFIFWPQPEIGILQYFYSIYFRKFQCYTPKLWILFFVIWIYLFGSWTKITFSQVSVTKAFATQCKMTTLGSVSNLAPHIGVISTRLCGVERLWSRTRKELITLTAWALKEFVEIFLPQHTTHHTTHITRTHTHTRNTQHTTHGTPLWTNSTQFRWTHGWRNTSWIAPPRH
jgi:hypothetical protein